MSARIYTDSAIAAALGSAGSAIEASRRIGMARGALEKRCRGELHAAYDACARRGETRCGSWADREHVWLVAFRGDAPMFPSAFPTVEATSWIRARSLAEMLPVVRAAGISRESLVLTRLEAR